MIGPTKPQNLQPLAHRPVGMRGLRFDARADDIAEEAIHRRRDPRVVARIPPSPSRRRGRPRKDRRVQPIDRPRPLPTPTTTRSVERAGVGAAEEAVEQVAHAGRVAWQGWGKLLGMFGKDWIRLVPDAPVLVRPFHHGWTVRRRVSGASSRAARRGRRWPDRS